jgi:ribonuclease HII
MSTLARAQEQLDRWAREHGYQHIVGVDEAGRGPWAGPVVVAAVLLRSEADTSRFVDSKALREKVRDDLFPLVVEACAAHSIVSISAARIDETNILRATLEGMKRAVLEVLAKAPQVDCVLVDGTQKIPHLALPCYPFPKADGKSRAVAAASILAKVTRDRYLAELEEKFPGYGFARHKGYGTAAHQEALRRLGPCPEHRRTFAPVRALLPNPPPEPEPKKSLRLAPAPKPTPAQLAPVQLSLLNLSNKGANDER